MAVVMDGLDAVSVGEAVAAARPDAIVHQMTAISAAHAGKPDLKHIDRWFATTNRLRTEGTDHLLAAAEATGVSHVVAQSYASWNGIRQGGWVKTEEDPLDPMTGTAAQPVMEAIRHLEDVVVKAGGAVLRYGGFYGPGATDDQVELVRKRQFPLVGGGTGYFSWVHLDDAASATVLAVEQKATGVFNIVDDEPAPASEWLPYLAECAGAKPPMRVPDVAGPAAGRGGGGDDDDRGARLLQRQGQAGARLGAALPVVAAGLQGRAGVTRAEEFEELRPLLFAIAYRILGSVSEAEDAVQETWLRYEASADPARRRPRPSSRPWSPGSRSTCCARPASGGRSTSGSGSPSRCSTDPYEDPERSAELADSVSMAALLLLERLSPLERAVFVLREVFGFGFPEIAVGGGAVGGGVPPARGAGAPPHGRRAAPVRGRPPGARGARRAVLRRLPGRRRRRAAGAARRRRPDGRRRRRQGPAVGQGRHRRRQRGPGARRDRPAARPDRRRRGAARGERPAGRDLPRPGRQGRQHLDARRPRRADPDDPLGDQPRQARAPGSGGGRLGGRSARRTRLAGPQIDQKSCLRSRPRALRRREASMRLSASMLALLQKTPKS